MQLVGIKDNRIQTKIGDAEWLGTSTTSRDLLTNQGIEILLGEFSCYSSENHLSTASGPENTVKPIKNISNVWPVPPCSQIRKVCWANFRWSSVRFLPSICLWVIVGVRQEVGHVHCHSASGILGRFSQLFVCNDEELHLWFEQLIVTSIWHCRWNT